MMNVSDYIVRATAKAAAAGHPSSRRSPRKGLYEIYHLRDNDPRYAVPLADAPHLVLGERWKESAYLWFRRAKPGDVVPVFAEHVTPEEERLFAGVSHALPETFERRPVAASPGLREEMPAPDHLVVTGTQVGRPILIRISYHPRWRAVTGEKIWLAGPSFMLVFPKGDRVELEFGDGPPVAIGRWATGLGILLSSCRWSARRGGSCRLLGSEAEAPPPPARWVEPPGAPPAGPAGPSRGPSRLSSSRSSRGSPWQRRCARCRRCSTARAGVFDANKNGVEAPLLRQAVQREVPPRPTPSHALLRGHHLPSRAALGAGGGRVPPAAYATSRSG
jgi:hypothetical protein